MTDKEITVATYDASAKGLAQYFSSVGSRVGDIERGLSLVGREDPFVFEIGCGNGRDAQEILKRVKRYVGMDISDEMVRLARELNPGGQFEVGDIESYSFPHSIDIIFSFASLLHSDRQAVGKILQRGWKVLISGGVFYVSLKKAPYARFIKKDEFGERVFYSYEPKDIEDLAGDKFKTEYLDFQTVGSTDWFTIALRKVEP